VSRLGGFEVALDADLPTWLDTPVRKIEDGNLKVALRCHVLNKASRFQQVLGREGVVGCEGSRSCCALVDAFLPVPTLYTSSLY